MPTTLLVILAIWVGLYLSAVVARKALGCTALSIGWCSISIQTSSLNRIIHRLGRQQYGSLWRQWFGMGVVVAGMLSISAVFILLRELWQAASWVFEVATDGSSAPPVVRTALGDMYANHGSMLRLAIPGVTVPWSQAAYLWLATAVSMAVHETGHALAAASEGVGVQQIGAFVLLLLPGAYVALDTHTLGVLAAWRTLRVVCAGVWHNAVLCVLCWLLALLLPWLLLPWYSTGQGAVVRFAQAGSPLAQHLQPGDVITGVNQCPVKASADWVQCLRSPITDPANIWLPVQQRQLDAAGRGEVTAEQLMELMSRGGPYAGLGYCIPWEASRAAPACAGAAGDPHCGANQLCFVEHQQLVRPEEPRKRRLDEHRPAVLARSGSSSSGGAHAPGNAWSVRDSASNDGTSARQLEQHASPEGVCMSARAAAASMPCFRNQQRSRQDQCPSDTTCMVPILPQGDQMFKVCYKSATKQRQPVRKGRHLRDSPVTPSTDLHNETSEAPVPDTQLSFSIELDTQDRELAAWVDQTQSNTSTPALGMGYAGHADSQGVAGDQHSKRQHTRSGEESRLAARYLRQSMLSDVGQTQRNAAEGACEQFIVFVGSQGTLLRSVEVTSYRPLLGVLPLGFPHVCEQLLAYTFAVSAALALLNMAPVFYLDGEAALEALVNFYLKRDLHTYAPNARRGCMRFSMRDGCRRLVLQTGTLVFVLVLAVHVLQHGGYDASLCKLIRTAGRAWNFVMS